MEVENEWATPVIVGDSSPASKDRWPCCPCPRLVRCTHSEYLDCTRHTRLTTRHRLCSTSRRRIFDRHRGWRVGAVEVRLPPLDYPPYLPSIRPSPSRRPPSASSRCRSDSASRNIYPAMTAAVDCNSPR